MHLFGKKSISYILTFVSLSSRSIIAECGILLHINIYVVLVAMANRVEIVSKTDMKHSMENCLDDRCNEMCMKR